MDIKCPHCGTEYEVDNQDVYCYVDCEVCGEKFAIGKRSKRQKVKSVLCIVLCVLVMSGIASYCGYLYFGDQPRLARGIAYYEKGEYPDAFKLLMPLASKNGFAEAQLIVGDCHAHGHGVFMDTEKAVKWYRLAADKGLPEAQYRMFVCYRDGIGMERNQANAAKWCRKAAEAGHEEAMFDMGMLYISGTGVEENAKSAFRWFRKGSERGHPMCLYKLGQCYKFGVGVEKDEDEASKWQNKAVETWKSSANVGDVNSMVRLAELYMEGDVVELDKEKAVRWYHEAAERGNSTAQFRLATCYYSGEGVEENWEEAARWMLKSAEDGSDRGSQWMMGRYYQDGVGVEKSLPEAVKWFERSAKKGFAAAKYSLAMCYLSGKGISKDVGKGELLLEEASRMGDNEAKKELSRIRNERAAEEARIAREKAEKGRRIERLSCMENEIKERKTRINNILRGKLKDDTWIGFDAGKVTMTDASVSIAEEPQMESVADGLTEMATLEEIGNAILAAEKESKRLEDRLKEFVRVKGIYDAKELESRKETCVPCNGTGTVVCARCKGAGAVANKVTRPCPICCSTEENESWGDTYFAVDPQRNEHKGQVKRQIDCDACRGKGMVRPRCGNCNGKGVVRCPACQGASLQKMCSCRTGKVKCYSCGGSGYGSECCRKCQGNGTLTVWQACDTCHGRGVVADGGKDTCPVCNGMGRFECERCYGSGFVYREKP